MSINLLEDDKNKPKIISLMQDWVFKRVYGDPEDVRCLSHFFRIVYPGFKAVRLFPEEAPIGHPRDKAIRYDICGIINEEVYFSLEMQQAGSTQEQAIRIVFYLSRLLSSQNTKGKEYRELKPVWVIMISKYSFFNNPAINRDIFHLVGEKTGMTLTEHIQVSIIELETVALLQELPARQLSPLDRLRAVWAFAGDPEKATWIQQIVEVDKNCESVVNKMLEIPQSTIEYMRETSRLDREMLMTAEIRREKEKAVREAQALALKQGLEEGRAEGLSKIIKLTLKKAEQGRTAAEIAKDLLEEEQFINTIMEMRALFPEETELRLAMKILTRKSQSCG